MTLPDLYTIEEAALRLKLIHKGAPNIRLLRRLVATGDLDCVRFSRNNICFTEEQLAAYVEKKTWRYETKVRTSPSEKTEDGGESSNTGEDNGIGLKAATEASKTLRTHLRSLNAAPPVPLRRRKERSGKSCTFT